MSASADEDDRTQVQRPPMPPTGVVAPPPAPIVDNDSHALPIGTRLDEFELTHRLGEGGFSIVYIAWDHSLDRKVALKEYMPGSLAARVGTTQIRPRSERHRETFEAGLKSFINEAKLLARFDHPALVKVYRFWEANGTAYLVMPLYEGSTLKDKVRAMPQPPDEAWLINLLAPLTAALNVIHDEHCYHRDIAPDNIMLLTDGGKPLLLDFGAARRVIGDMTQALTVILKPGYAPVEQYAEVPGMKQGAWTDVYALAATVYWAVTGRTPPPSVGRMLSDAYVPLAQSGAGRYSARFLEAIDRALVVLPDQRTQTIDDLRRDLGIDGSAPAQRTTQDLDATVIRPAPPRTNQTRADQTHATTTPGVRAGSPQTTPRSTPRTAPQTTPPSLPGSSPRDAAIAKDDATLAWANATATDTQTAGAPVSAATSSAPASRKGALIAGVTAALVVAAGAAWWATRSPSPAPSATVPSTTADAPARPSVSPSTQPAPEAASPQPVATTPAPSTTNTSAQAVPNTPARNDVAAPSADTSTLAPPSAPPPETTAAPTATAPARPPAIKSGADKTEKSAEKSTEKSTDKADAAARNAECAQIYQRLSLGETRPDLIERMKVLKCR